MPEKHKLPKGALRLVAEGCHANVKMAEKDGKEVPMLQMTVYSGQPIDRHWYWGKLAIDLQGIKFDKSKYPVLEGHCTTQKIAFSRKPLINGTVTLDPATTMFVSTKASDEFQKLSKEGFPYQASIYAIPSVIERVEEGSSVEVNGYKLKGPAVVWRKCLYQEASICVFGWDKKTEATAFSKEEVELDMQFINNKGGDADENEEKLKLKLRKGGEKTMPKTVAELKEKFPGLAEELSDEVKGDLQTTFDKEKTAMQAEITKLSSEKEETAARVLSLEKKDTLRSEKELALNADRIWNEKLAASNVAEHLFDKVRKHVGHTKFVKDGIFDHIKFGEAIDVEIKDWESRGATSTVLGAGFSEASHDNEFKQANAQEKEDDGMANELLQMAGQEQKTE